MLAVSNWVSNTVSLIDYEAGSVVCTLKTGREPRGTAFTSGCASLIVLCFGGGSIEKFDIESDSLIQSIEKEKAAMCHIVINADETKAYVSDMYHRSVYEIDLMRFTIARSIRAFSNPNTLVLYGSRLFVFSRGQNNPEDYTKRSDVNGKLSVSMSARGKSCRRRKAAISRRDSHFKRRRIFVFFEFSGCEHRTLAHNVARILKAARDLRVCGLCGLCGLRRV